MGFFFFCQDLFLEGGYWFLEFMHELYFLNSAPGACCINSRVVFTWSASVIFGWKFHLFFSERAPISIMLQSIRYIEELLITDHSSVSFFKGICSSLDIFHDFLRCECSSTFAVGIRLDRYNKCMCDLDSWAVAWWNYCTELDQSFSLRLTHANPQMDTSQFQENLFKY